MKHYVGLDVQMKETSKRHDPPPLQVADDRAVAVVPAPGPVIDADHIQRIFRQARCSVPG